MPAGNLLNLCGRHRFRVEIDGITQISFKEVEGICANIEVNDFREGSDIPSISKTVPGLIHYGPLTLKNAVTGNAGNKDLWNWIKQIINGEDDKRKVSIIVMDRKGNDILRFDLTAAWPSSWHLGRLDSHQSSPLVEEVVLQYETLTVS